MPKDDVTVTGIVENQRALKRAGELDVVRAATEAAQNLIPYIQARTRSGDTGRLRSGWMADNGNIINEVEYAGYEEYGTVYISPMDAIGYALEQHEDLVTKAFEKESEHAADKAGLGGKRSI